MERLVNHLHEPPCFDDDGDVFLTLSCGSSSEAAAAAAAGMPPPAQLAPPPRVLRGRRRRRRGHHASSSFDCRTCGREFATFQALGGHRTSHLRRPATMTKKKTRSSKAVQLVHACAACGLGFSTGQALGGHMRKHRGGPRASTTTATEKEEEEGCGGPNNDVYAVGLTRAVVLHDRPSSAPLQLLDLFV